MHRKKVGDFGDELIDDVVVFFKEGFAAVANFPKREAPGEQREFAFVKEERDSFKSARENIQIGLEEAGGVANGGEGMKMWELAEVDWNGVVCGCRCRCCCCCCCRRRR